MEEEIKKDMIEKLVKAGYENKLIAEFTRSRISWQKVAAISIWLKKKEN